jgi:glycosyltransferase involved in cell wall biosynthesis
VALPYRHLFALRALSEKPDVVHFQSLTPFLLPARPSRSWLRALAKGPVFLAQVAVLRLAGCRIVYTVHNLVNHERRLARLEWFFGLLFSRLTHRMITHGRAAAQAVIHTYRLRRRADRVAVVPCPGYIGAYPRDIRRAEARERVGAGDSSVLILCLGQIRPYKALLELVGAFQTLGKSPPAELWIAGEPIDPALAKDLQEEARASTNIHFRPAHLPPAEVSALLEASDLVALPYRSILTSGGARLAMSFGRACVAPRLGDLVELLDERGAFLYDPADPHGLRNALQRAVESSSRLPGMGRHNFERVSQWTWPQAAGQMLDLYRAASD